MQRVPLQCGSCPPERIGYCLRDGRQKGDSNMKTDGSDMIRIVGSRFKKEER